MLALLLLLCALFALLPISSFAAETVESGTDTNKSISWALDSEGTLTFVGSGEIGGLCASLADKVKKVVIREGITSVGGYMFQNFTELTEVNIPEGVTKIGNLAFDGCMSLESVNIPSSVTTMGSFVFEGCSSLTSITVSDGNEYFSDIDGVLCNQMKNRLYAYPPGREGAYEVPDGIRVVEKEAFWHADKLTGVVVPDSVTRIDAYAFRCCSALSDVTLPQRLAKIDEGVFCGCTSLTKISIPESVKSIEHSAFSGCRNLTDITIPENVTNISNSAFYRCTELESIYIPKNVESIGDYAFQYCASLRSITVDGENEHYSDIDGVLFDKDKTVLVSYPFGKGRIYTVPDGVAEIARCAFEGCESISSVTIPASAGTIGIFAFRYCTSLCDVTFEEGITLIDGGAFCGCTSLTDIALPESAAAVGDYVFQDCTNLESVSIPLAVTKIGSDAFKSCGKLTDVYYLGSEEQWKSIEIASGSEVLENAAVHFGESAPPPITVTLNGVKIEFDQKPVITEGRALVPLRAIFEALGAEVSWNQETRTATASKDNVTVSITIGNTEMTRNGKAITLDVPAQLINSRTLVPARVVAESFDCKVDWDNDTRTVAINN